MSPTCTWTSAARAERVVASELLTVADPRRQGRADVRRWESRRGDEHQGQRGSSRSRRPRSWHRVLAAGDQGDRRCRARARDVSCTLTALDWQTPWRRSRCRSRADHDRRWRRRRWFGGTKNGLRSAMRWCSCAQSSPETFASCASSWPARLEDAVPRRPVRRAAGGGPWRSNASHANAMARRLVDGSAARGGRPRLPRRGQRRLRDPPGPGHRPPARRPPRALRSTSGTRRPARSA